MDQIDMDQKDIIDIRVTEPVLILYVTLLAHDFHHDFMHLGVGRVTDALYQVGNTLTGGNKRRRTDSEYDDDIKLKAYSDKYYNFIDEESLEENSGFDTLINDIYTSLYYDDVDDQFAKLIEDGIKGIEEIEENFMKFNRPSTPKTKTLKVRPTIKKRRRRRRKILSNIINLQESVALAALPKKRKKKAKRNKLKTVRNNFVKKLKTIKKRIISRKKKKQSRKKKQTTKKKKKEIKNKSKMSGGTIRIPRGGPIKLKLAAIKPILSDLLTEIGRDVTERYNEGEIKVINPSPEIYEEIIKGWDEAFDAYSTILSSNTLSAITTMDQLNVEIIRLYNNGTIKLVPPYDSRPDILIPEEGPITSESIYSSNKPPDEGGNPSDTFQKTIATCLCMLVKSKFFTDAEDGRIFRYDHNTYIEVDYAWYFAMKIAQLKYKVSPRFKNGICVSENIDGMDNAVVERINEKYTLRGSNTFARYIELLIENGIQIPPFKRPQLSPEQKKLMKQFGIDISRSWASMIPTNTNTPETSSINKIKGFLKKGVSTDSQVDKVMTDYFNTSGVTIISYQGPPTNPPDILTSYSSWKTSGVDLCLQVMDNAAPLGKWPDLFGGTHGVHRTNYLPRALDAAGSPNIDNAPDKPPLNDSKSTTIYNITDRRNYVRLTYIYDGNNIKMNIEIYLNDQKLESNYSCDASHLVTKPFSVKEVIRELFTKVIELSGTLPTNLTQLLESTSSMSHGSLKDIYYRKHILPIVMHKLSGDMGQEVSACGGIVRSAVFTPITQVHNDIPAFLRGVLLSSKRDRSTLTSSGGPAQAPVIFQTAHSGRYMDQRL